MGGPAPYSRDASEKSPCPCGGLRSLVKPVGEPSGKHVAPDQTLCAVEVWSELVGRFRAIDRPVREVGTWIATAEVPINRTGVEPQGTASGAPPVPPLA